MFALFIHIYYPESWETIFKERLNQLKAYSPVILINLFNAVPGRDNIVADIKNSFPTALVITTPNKGRDIGGKLALIDLFLRTQQQSDYIVLLHDKKTPDGITGDRWRTKLFSVIDPGTIDRIINRFSNQRTGIVGPNDFIRSEFNKEHNELETTNSVKLEELIKKYGLKLTDYRFVAGTMFWIRTKIITEFFSKYSPLGCREMLEEGDFTDRDRGTYTHSWERLFCWLANDRHYTIKGI